MAHRTGFEPATYRIGICCSIQLSYRSVCGKRTARKYSVLLCESGFQRLCELIGAGGASGTAFGALETFDDVGCLHAFDELGDALGVAVASADELNGIDHAVGKLHLDLAGASTFGCVFNVFCHGDYSFILFFVRKTVCISDIIHYIIYFKKR